MDYLDYRKALGIEMFDSEKQRIFKSRIQTYLQAFANFPFEPFQEAQFSYQIGDPCLCEANNWDYEINAPTGPKRIWLYLQNHQNDFADFLSCLCTFINTYKCNASTKASIRKAIENALKDSHIQFEIYKDKDGVFYFPKGVPEFDKALVSEPFQWIKEYPVTQIAFAKALREYASNDESNASEIIDALRKALESFFQQFFNSNQTLENLKNVYGSFLKEHGVPKEIASNFETLLNQYTNYNNNYAKHRDRSSLNVAEYMLYQTGNIMRLLLTLKHAEEKKES